MMTKESETLRKEEIVSLWKKNTPIRDIIRITKYSRTTVWRCIQRYQTLGEKGIVDMRQFNGRSRATTAKEDRAIVKKIENNHFQNACNVLANLELSVSDRTVRNRLREAGFHCCQLGRKVLLQKHRHEPRVGFALEQLPTTQFEWDCTIFTDEKVFTSSTDCTFHAWKPEWNEECVSPYSDSDPVTCVLWGWISAHGPSELVEVSPRMDSLEYIDILENILMPSIRKMYPKELKLVQDNNTLHTSAPVREWFAKHPEIHVLQWLARSPDLNVTENVWTRIVLHLPSKNYMKSRNALVSHIMREWDDLSLI